MTISWRLAPVLGVALLGTLAVLLPLLATGWISFLVGVPGQGYYTLQNYATAVSDSFGYRALLNTVIFAIGSTALAIAIGAPLAWAVARTDLPYKHAITLALGLVLVIPGFIQGIGWAVLLSPNIGLINRLLTQGLGLADAPFNIYTLPGMTFVQGLELVPPLFFILLPALMALDASFEEAAYLSGVSKARTFFRVNLPLALPALVAGGIYILVLASTLFEVPAVLGYPNRIFVFSTMIYFLVSAPSSDLPAYGLAAAYGSLIVLASVLLLTQYARILSQGRKYATITGKGRRARILRLGRWRTPALGLAVVYLLLAIGLPLLTLVYFSLLPFFQIPSLQALRSLTLRNYAGLLDAAGSTPFVNTGLLVLIVPLAVILLAFPISWITVRSRLRGRFVLDQIAFLPLAVPRIVLAVSILYLGLVFRQVIPVYGTILIIMAAHVVVFIGFATRTLSSAILQIHPDLEEAGRVSGVSTVRILARVTVPLLRPALFFTWFWVLLLSFREVTMALVLASTNSVVLPVLIWNTWSSARPHQAAAAAVVLVLIAMAVMFLLRRRVAELSSTGAL